MALEDCPPEQREQGGGFCGEQATKHSWHNGESGRQVQLVHTLLYTPYDPTVLGNKAGAPQSNGVFVVDAGGLNRVSPIVCFVAAVLL